MKRIPENIDSKKKSLKNRYCTEKPYYDIIIGDEGLIGWGHRDAEKVLRLERR